MSTFRRARCLLLCLVALSPAAFVCADESSIPAAPDRDDPPRVFVSGVKDEFSETRAAIATAKQRTGRDYRVVVVDSAARPSGSVRVVNTRVASALRRFSSAVS